MNKNEIYENKLIGIYLKDNYYSISSTNIFKDN